MLCETVYLREAEGDKNVRLETYVSKKEGDMESIPPRDAIIIIPGGAYCFLAEREAEPCVKQFLAKGFNAFLLYYSICRGDICSDENYAKFPRPLVDVSMAIAHIKRHAEEYNINPDRIFVCGFSAGGHLAGAIGTFWHQPMAAFDGMQEYENKPAGVILSYPASSQLEYGHDLCRRVICGSENPTEEEKNALSLELQVNKDTVPHFVWQTQEDNCVMIENTVLLVNALVKAKVPTEYHMFPSGPHGMSVALPEVKNWDYVSDEINAHVSHWVEMAYEWTQLTGKEKKDEQ